MMKLFLDISTLSQKKHVSTSCVFHSSVFLLRPAVKFKSHSPIISHFPCVLSQQWWRLTDTNTPWLRGPGAWDVIHRAEFDKKAIDTKLQRPVVSPECGAELDNRSYHELWDIKWEWSRHWHKLISSNTSQCSGGRTLAKLLLLESSRYFLANPLECQSHSGDVLTISGVWWPAAAMS